ncbi:hypothetical protein ACIOD1_01960 [Streptomyces sp. NPDC088097]|uniref:hypothetical protein n=1 Tax=Streptomyces sp. NPDC088097 TaxID=3365823 RepID=UPI003813E349
MTSNPSTPENDGPKTETTLTTRIRINIPGSRPIPPVVVRKPVKGGSSAGSPAAADPQPPAPAPHPAQPSAGGPAPARGDRPGAPAPGRGAPGQGGQPPAPGQGGGGEPTGNWFAPRKNTPPPAPQAPAGASYGSAPAPAPAPPAGPGPGSGSGSGGGFAPPAGPGGQQQHPQQQQQSNASYGNGGGFAPAPAVGGPGVGTPYGAYDNGPVTEAFPAFAEPTAPAGPTGGPAMGTVPVHDEPSRWPGPEALAAPASGYTPASVPAAAPVPAPPAPGPRPTGPTPAPAGKPGKQAKGSKPAAGKPAKKGRSKVALLGGALFGLVGLAYGAGLLMNHSDVPKGTTVLGEDIGGTRDEAVTKLDAAFGKRASAPLQLSVGGKQVELKPEKAGLTLDSQTTVRNAAGSDYNPVTVIGSLFGAERTAQAVMPVDEEKLRVSLQELAGAAGSAGEGTITFDTGKAVAVPGKAGASVDVDGSVERVTAAFRELVGTGKAAPVELPTATKEPTINQGELDRAMKEFAEPAMSGVATVRAGAKSIPFGAKSLPKILSMQAVDGHLVEKYDKEALKATYGNAFDGVLITRGNGSKTAVTPEDVVGALRKALVGKTPAERTVTIDTNPS